ncbi:MAG: ester cyclase [Dehalococcoidia bacterium]|nr:ester cyclase [Dehalococcoidia bacterium]
MSDAASIAREYNDAWNRRDWARYRELLHPEYTYTGGDGQAQKGQDAGLAVGQMFATAFPDGRIDVQSIHAAGNIATVEFIGRGTHKGDLMGIAPTGRQITIPVCDVIEVRDGKIITEREYMDMLHMMQQLGVAPALATA